MKTIKEIKYRIQEIGVGKSILIILGAFLMIIYVIGLIKQSFSADVLLHGGSISMNPFTVIWNMFTSGTGFGIVILFALLAALFIPLYAITKNKFDGGEEDPLGRFKHAESGSMGSSHFMDMEEIETTFDYGPLSAMKGKGPILGTYRKKFICVPYDRSFAQSMPNKNILLIGVPGSAKTTSTITPNVYQAIDRGESVITTDVKGDVYAQTFGYAMRNGYNIKVFNTDNCETSDGWNIIKSVGTSIALAQQLSNCILKNTLDPEKKAPEEYFENGMFNLLTALILYVNKEKEDMEEVHGHERELYPLMDDPSKGYGTIGRLYNILLGIVYNRKECSSYQDRSGREFKPSTYDKIRSLFKAIEPEEEECDEMHPAYQAWLVFESTQQKNRENFIASLATRLRLLQEKEARIMLGKDDIDLSLPGREKTIIYVNKPEDDETHTMMTASFFSMLFTSLTKLARNSPDRTLPVPVNMILDEFANLGKIPNFEKKPAVVRSQGISLMISVQTLGQLKRMYPNEEWANIKAMCGITMMLAVGDDLITAEEFSRSAGKTTIRAESTRTQRSTFSVAELIDSYSDCVGEQQRDLLTPDEIRRILKTQTLIIPSNHNPLIVDKFVYTDMPQSKYCMIPVNINNHKENMENYGCMANQGKEQSRFEKDYVLASDSGIGYYHSSDVNDFDDDDEISIFSNENYDVENNAYIENEIFEKKQPINTANEKNVTEISNETNDDLYEVDDMLKGLFD